MSVLPAISRTMGIVRSFEPSSITRISPRMPLSLKAPSTAPIIAAMFSSSLKVGMITARSQDSAIAFSYQDDTRRWIPVYCPTTRAFSSSQPAAFPEGSAAKMSAVAT